MIEGGPTGTEEELEDDGFFTKMFSIDRGTLCYLRHDVFGSTKVWTHASRYQGSPKCGRRVQKLIWDHFLGPNNVHHIANASEAKLRTLTYVGGTS